jgi:hypothetical protein
MATEILLIVVIVGVYISLASLVLLCTPSPRNPSNIHNKGMMMHLYSNEDGNSFSPFEIDGSDDEYVVASNASHRTKKHKAYSIGDTQDDGVKDAHGYVPGYEEDEL